MYLPPMTMLPTPEILSQCIEGIKLQRTNAEKDRERQTHTLYSQYPGAFTHLAEASPAQIQAFTQKLKNLSGVPNEELHALLVACCIELQALQTFKTFFSILREKSKEWRSLPIPKTSMMFHSTEALTFCFRFQETQRKSASNPHAIDKNQLLQSALQSSNSEIRDFAENNLNIQKRNRLIAEITHLTFPFVSETVVSIKGFEQMKP